MVAERDRAVASTKNSVRDHNTNQVSTKILKAAISHHKQEIASLTEEMKLTKSSVAYFQVETKAMSSESKIAVSKVQKLKG